MSAAAASAVQLRMKRTSTFAAGIERTTCQRRDAAGGCPAPARRGTAVTTCPGIDEGWRLRMDRGEFVAADWAALVDRFADDVHDTAESLRADRHLDLRTGGVDLLAAGQTFGCVHRDRADDILAEVLRNLEHQALTLVLGFQRGEDRRQLAFEGDVDDGADHLRDLADDISANGRRLGSGRALGRGLLGAGLGLSGGCHVRFPCLFLFVLERFGARDDFDEFGGDRRLALAVVLN